MNCLSIQPSVSRVSAFVLKSGHLAWVCHETDSNALRELTNARLVRKKHANKNKRVNKQSNKTVKQTNIKTQLILHTHTHTHTSLRARAYIYIYIHRERESEREGDRNSEIERYAIHIFVSYDCHEMCLNIHSMKRT